ncbi:transmembrane protein 234 homolog [Leptopilina heterotoma]|uniref:transmembrane protein 234 homolog n=1 Tax=Leptopilina heterotoma TaxID=63436 RepID=UPI001CA7EDE0|nr:transmembrane protein 234 homolog [Leptopilina heterotoma]
MALSFESIMLLVVVALFWGTTNPFMKKGAVGIERIKASSRFKQLLQETLFLFTNFKYLAPFVINQIGSVVYYFTLQTTDLSLAIPVSNSLTFLITALTGRLLGEGNIHRNTYIGMLFILFGTTLCCYDKIGVAGTKLE